METSELGIETNEPHCFAPAELMHRAFDVAQNSTCARRRVGAIIATEEGEIVSYGWNHGSIPSSSTNISCSPDIRSSCEARYFYEYAKYRLSREELEEFCSDLTLRPYNTHYHADCKKDGYSAELLAVWEEFKVFTKTSRFKEEHSSWQNSEIHSELHAILRAYQNGNLVTNCVLYSSRSPCIACAHAIIESGIKKVYYTELSQAGTGGIPILEQAGVEVEHLPIETDLYT